MATATMTNKAPRITPIKTAPVLIDSIERDERVNTRPINEAWVTARVEKFYAEGIGVPAVSLRADGTYIVLNGQNRLALAKACGYGGHTVDCQIYEGLDLAGEARMFVVLNDERTLRPVHLFKARVTQRDPVAVAILETAELAGWKIEIDPGPGVITAVSALERLWKNDRKHHPHDTPFVVANTLQTIVQAWQHTDKAADADIIKAIGFIYVRDGQAVDLPHMVGRLATTSPKALMLAAKGLQSGRGGAMANSVAELVILEYNKDKPRRRLRAWR